MIGHKGQRKSTRKGDAGREGSCEKVNHGDGKGSKDKRQESKIPFRLCKRIKRVGENKKKRGVEIRRILLVEFYLLPKPISGIIEGMDFVQPQRLLIKRIKPQEEPNKKAEDQKNRFFPIEGKRGSAILLQRIFPFLATQRIETPKGKDRYLRREGSRENTPFRMKLRKGKLTLFSDSILTPRR